MISLKGGQDDGSLIAKGIHPDEGCIWSVHQGCLPVKAWNDIKSTSDSEVRASKSIVVKGYHSR